jgi:hypothetical protein
LLPTLLLDADLLIEPGASPSLMQPGIEIYQLVYTPNTSDASVEIPRAKGRRWEVYHKQAGILFVGVSH